LSDHGTWFQGYFLAPATTNYRFYLSGDDKNELWLDSTTPYDPDTAVDHTLVNIATTWAISWREADKQSSTATPPVSDWIALEEGKYYKMESLHKDTGGDSHHTVSVEIETADSTGHHAARREQQYLEITNDDVPEKWTIEIQGIDDGMYKLNFVHPLTSETW